MKKIKITIAFIGLILNVIGFAQPVTQEWVRRFTDTSSASVDGLEIKNDSLGYIYVLTYGTYGYGFLKYSPNGALLFNAYYNPPGYDINASVAFDVTPQGNVYIIGDSYISFSYWLYVVKFNTNGVFQWAKLYNKDNIDAASDIKVDRNGNAIVVGGATNGSSNMALTIKYNTNGDTLWTSYFNGGQSYAHLNHIVLDDTNNIYTSGYITNVGKCLIQKYSSTGILDWYTTFTLEAGRSNIGSGISLDLAGNVYVVGTQVIYGPGYHSYLLKVTNSGTIVWNKVFTGTVDGQVGTTPKGPAISSDGSSIYYTVSTGTNYIATLKYNSIGDTQWVKLYGFGGAPYGIKMDKYNDVYVCGLGFYPSTGEDFVTLKYTAAGLQQWVTTYSGEMTSGEENAEDLIIDTNLNVYVTGNGQNLFGRRDAITIKYDQPVGIVNQGVEFPTSYRLFQNYPNPFNSSTLISYQLPKDSDVELLLFNSLGQLVRSVLNRRQTAGTYSIMVNMENLSSGIYFYRLRIANEFIETKKLIMIK